MWRPLTVVIRCSKQSLVAVLLALLLTPQLAIADAQPPQYQTDQAHVTQALNNFWTLQSLGQTTAGIKANWGALLGSSDWYEWNSLKLNWSSDMASKNAQRNLLLNASISGVNAKGAQAVGYVWPSNGSESWLCPHPHFDQMPRFICAVYNDYIWSHDLAFLQKMQSKSEAVMDYMAHAMQGQSGLLRCPEPYNGLTHTGPNTTYMDCYREGGAVTWIEAGYYTALQDMVTLETVLGHRDKAAAYATQARQLQAQFQAQLWNKNTLRYAGWQDSGGALHDYGFTYVNLEALARGLGNAENAYHIFDWLDNGMAQPTVMGGHVGSRDIYQCVIAPRSNTVAISPADWDPWSVSETLRGSTMGYGALVEDGGAMLWVNYYDVMARLKWLDADNAWRKFAAMLYRIEGDPLLFTESVSHPTNTYGENYLEVGPADGTENSLNAVAPLAGFMGIQPRVDGLYATPNLPTSLLFLTSHHVSYGSNSYDIQVTRGQVVTEVAPLNSAVQTSHSTPLTGTTEQQFTAGAPFNTLGFFLTPAGGPAPMVSAQLQKRRGGVWLPVAATAVTARYPNMYCYVAVPLQVAGAYKITLTPMTGSVIWHKLDGSYTCRAAYEPTMPIATGVIKGASVAITTKQTFSSIAVDTTEGGRGLVILVRKLGVNWRPVETTWTATPRGGVLSFADQPGGSYRLQFNTAVAGNYQLLSHIYTTIITNGASSTIRTVTAGATVKLSDILGPPMGHRIAIYAPSSERYVSAATNPADILTAGAATTPGPPEMFDVYDAGNGRIALKSEANGHYITTNPSRQGGLELSSTNSTSVAAQFIWQHQISGTFALSSPVSKYYVSTDLAHNNQLTAGFATTAGAWEQFTWLDAGTY